MSNTENNKRIAKNTILLYLRMLLTMGVSLYTSRIVLNTLGIEDFGIYNVVGGIVVLFGFLNSAMTAGTQRFLSFELGKKNDTQLKKVFSMSLVIHILIALIIVLFAETVGLWLLYNKLNIPISRFEAAKWVYQFSILSFFITVVQVPYNAIIIAHERMKIYAYISILDIFIKLVMVVFLVSIQFDKLKIYSVLIFAITLTTAIIYKSYCKHQFVECDFEFSKDKALFNTLIRYSSWNLFGGIAIAVANQGINIVLNIFFGPVVNAARGIAYQVNATIGSFISNFQVAVNPQIVKSFAINDIVYMKNLIYNSAKYSLFIILIIAIPFLLETKLILNLWLKNVPSYTVLFCQLVIINLLIDSLSGSLVTAVQATGNIKQYQITVGLIIMSNLPISYLFLKYYSIPELTFYISITISILALIARIQILKKSLKITMYEFCKKVLFKVITVTFFTLIICLFLQSFFEIGIQRLILIFICSPIITIFWIYFKGLTGSEKQIVINKVNYILNDFKDYFIKSARKKRIISFYKKIIYK